MSEELLQASGLTVKKLLAERKTERVKNVLDTSRPPGLEAASLEIVPGVITVDDFFMVTE